MSKRTHSIDGDVTTSNSPPRALQAAAEAGLGSLIQRALWLDQLNHLFRQCLPPTLAGQCRFANVDKDKLVFLVNSPAWKSKLRLHADVLLDAAATAGLTVCCVVIKVAPVLPKPQVERTGKPLSQAVRNSLQLTAQSVQDPELKAQLIKLASLP